MKLLDEGRDTTLGLYRIVVGALFACHGAASLFGILGGAGTHGGAVAFGAWPAWWAALIELVGGILAVLGLATRAAAVICSGSMAYAYFTVHQAKGLLPIENGGEAAAMFCWAFFLLVFTGPGAFALDTLLARRRRAPEISQAGLGATA